MNNEFNQTENNITLAPEEKIRQQKVGLIIAIAVFGVIVVTLSFVDMSGGFNQKKRVDNSDDYEITIADPTKNVKTEERWLVSAQDRLDKHQSNIEQTIKENDRLKQELDDMKEGRELEEDRFRELEDRIFQLTDLINRKSTVTQNNKHNRSGQFVNQDEVISDEPLIETVNFGDDEIEEERSIYDIRDGWVPALSYASAKIISSVDVQVGVATQANPKPVLIKIKGKAMSAFFKGKQLLADIKGCKVNGGAIGELSSEKVYIKLSKIVCAVSDNEVVEIPVKGYVAASGSSGARGRVVMREGDLVTKSLFAGMLSGIGSAYSQSLAPPLTFGGGTTTQNTISFQDAGKRGLGVGLESSSNSLSEYLMKRAEQYQPVITIPSGIDVEVVFLEGFYADGRKVKKKLNNNDNSSKNKK